MRNLVAVLSLLVLACGCRCSQPAAGQSHAAQADQQLKVVPLQFASAVEVAAEVGKAQNEAQLVADPRTNSVIVTAHSEEALAHVLELIARLDVEAPKPH